MKKTPTVSTQRIPLFVIPMATLFALQAVAQDTDRPDTPISDLAEPKEMEAIPPSSPDALADPTVEPKAPAAPAIPSPSRIQGDWPKKTRFVSIKATDASIPSILQDIAKQTRFGLVLDLPEEALQKKMTLRLVRKPAKDVLEIVLENATLKATLKGDILFVTASETPAPTETDPEVAAQEDTETQTLLQITTRSSDKKHKQHLKVQHEKNRVQIGKPIHIAVDEEVDDVVSVGGSVTVEGKVNGDAVSVGGTLTLASTAVVHGDAVSVGGALDVEPGAVVHGQQVNVGIPFPIGAILAEGEDGDINLALPSALSGLAGTFAAFSFFGSLLEAVLLFVLALAILALAPRRVQRIRDYLSERTGMSVLAGLIILLAFVPLIILLAVTIIGLPLIPVVIIALLVLIVFGLAAMLSWIGYKVPIFKKNKSQLAAITIGAVVFMLINLIPVAGPVLLFCIAMVAAGAALLSRLGSENQAK
ncbi:MAG: hypothetical protein QNJ97_03150 [Myxococcota bacterium]|nr:hypothetical protein [Myxococcota bacterium]